MFKKLILLLVIYFIAISSVLAVDNNISQSWSPKMNGPTAAPLITGPKNRHPTRAEIDRLKYTKDPEFVGKRSVHKKQESFWEWLARIFSSLF